MAPKKARKSKPKSKRSGVSSRVKKKPTTSRKAVAPISPAIPHADGRCPILALPNELLLEILSHVFEHGQRPPVCLFAKPSNCSQDEPGRPKPSNRLDPLLTCRGFYHAGIEAYYGGTIFAFKDVDHLGAITSGLGPRRRACIKKVMLDVQWNVPAVPIGLKFLELLCTFNASHTLQTDIFAAFPSLRNIWLCIYGTGPTLDDDGFTRFKFAIERVVKAVWTSKADVMEFDWPSRLSPLFWHRQECSDVVATRVAILSSSAPGP